MPKEYTGVERSVRERIAQKLLRDHDLRVPQARVKAIYEGKLDIDLCGESSCRYGVAYILLNESDPNLGVIFRGLYDLQMKKEEAVRSKQFDKASSLREAIKDLSEKLKTSFVEFEPRKSE